VATTADRRPLVELGPVIGRSEPFMRQRTLEPPLQPETA
jgi:hypothetical protein